MFKVNLAAANNDFQDCLEPNGERQCCNVIRTEWTNERLFLVGVTFTCSSSDEILSTMDGIDGRILGTEGKEMQTPTD